MDLLETCYTHARHLLETQKVEIVEKSLCWVWNGNESKEKLISLLQENFGKMLVRVLFWFPEHPNVLVLKAVGNFGTTCGGTEGVCHKQIVVQGISFTNTNQVCEEV